MSSNSNRTAKDDTLYLGFDTEYTAVSDVKGKTSNRLLSAQFWAIRDGQSWDGIKLLDGHRPKFAELIKWAIEEGVLQGVLERRPHRVILCAHYSIADLAGLRDRDALFRQLDFCKKTFVTFRNPIKVTYHDRYRNKHTVDVILRDPWLMTPAGSRKLETLGMFIGVPKVSIAPYRIDQMDVLLREAPALFEEYALTDAKIAALYTHQTAQFSLDLFGEDEAPPTIGVCALRLTLKTWHEKRINQHNVMGTEPVRRGRTIRSEKLPIRKDFENFATHAFAGGRNETYRFGPSPTSNYVDLDLAGAYSSALACLGMPLWERLRAVTSIDDFTLDVIGFGLVSFRFPDGTRFPCLPVRCDSSLIFPLEGEYYATAPEIVLARQMGAELTLKRGCVMPMDFSCRPFVAISQAVKRERDRFAERDGKGTLMEQLVKTIGNCVFGKLAQAIRPRGVFNTRTMNTEEMKPSPLTNPYLAAMVTGIIRAVLGEILTALPSHCNVISATTDGFLSDYPESDLAELCRGPICQMFADARTLIAGGGEILEMKHRGATRVMSWRTRGTATLECEDPKELILARAGIHTPQGGLEQQNEFIVKRFLGRQYGDEFKQARLRNARELYEEGGDLVSVESVVQHRMDYDWKRIPTGPAEDFVDGQPHVCFDTMPLRDAEQFQRLRERWNAFYERYRRPLKRLEDLRDFQEMAAVHESGNLVLPEKRAATYVARKMILVAYCHAEWGFERELSNSELARELTEAGFPTEVHEVENAARRNARLFAQCVEPTSEVLRLINFLEQRFPGFDRSQLLAA